MKPKFEVQDAHFIGKQYALHYVVIEPGEQKYVYHLSDDSAVHDPLSLSIKCYKISSGDRTLEMRQLLSRVTMLQPSKKARMPFFICKT